MAEPCRCGHKGEGPHPCHGKGHTCGQPASRRFYATGPATTPTRFGQVAFSAAETWACDACWAEYMAGRHAEASHG